MTIVIILSILTFISIIFFGYTLNKTVKTPEFKHSDQIEKAIDGLNKNIKDEFQRNRAEVKGDFKDNREELSKNLNNFEGKFIKNTNLLKDTVNENLKEIRTDNNQQLEKMRTTVDEKLQKTINERLKQSFSAVNDQLESVQRGLGEMKNLANDVGGLKKILTNVKTRGGLGEMQLDMLLQNILSPAQYSRNVITNPTTSNSVEFVINLPGNNENNDKVMLPIDAKFPKDVYENLVDAYESVDAEKINDARKRLRATIKAMAKDIKNKYIHPPLTTDFALLFLPFESLFSEVTRDYELVEELQRDLNITITGPSTISAILNSLQIGFRTLALQKRSSEVWEVLTGVKKEFELFSGLMSKAQKNIKQGLGHLDSLMGTRTRAIKRRLKDVESLEVSNNNKLIEENNLF